MGRGDDYQGSSPGLGVPEGRVSWDGRESPRGRRAVHGAAKGGQKDRPVSDRRPGLHPRKGRKVPDRRAHPFQGWRLGGMQNRTRARRLDPRHGSRALAAVPGLGPRLEGARHVRIRARFAANPGLLPLPRHPGRKAIRREGGGRDEHHGPRGQRRLHPNVREIQGKSSRGRHRSGERGGSHPTGP